MDYLSKIIEQHYATIGNSSAKALWLVPNYQLANQINQRIRQSSHQPLWGPSILTLPDWLQQMSGYKIPSNLQLLAQLYTTAKKIGKVPPFLRFIEWGKTLLRDFNKIDENLLDLPSFFEKMRREEQSSVKKEHTTIMKHFSKELAIILPLYKAYRQELIAAKYGYRGLVARQVYEGLKNKVITYAGETIITVNLHPLSLACQKILHVLDQQQVDIHCYYDVDSYYMEDRSHSAGYLLRGYAEDPLLGRHLSPPYPQQIVSSPPTVKVLAATTQLGQVAALIQQLETLIKEEKLTEKLDQIAIVLGDNSLLIPLLHSLPSSYSPINLVGGYPLIATSLYRLSILLIDFYYAIKEKRSPAETAAEAISSHPTITAEAQIIIDHAYTLPTATVWRFLGAFLASLEGPDAALAQLTSWEKVIVHHIGLWCQAIDLLPDSSLWTQEEALAFFQREAQQKNMPVKKCSKGITIMRFSDSKSLAARWVFVLGVQEGFMPPNFPLPSGIPRTWREKEGYPSTDQEEAAYAYLFYRLLHNSNHLYLLYGTGQKGNSLYEKSRYLTQLMYESPLVLTEQHVTPPPITLPRQQPLTIPKSKAIQAILAKFLATHPHPTPLTPSALNSYLECPICFYFQYVARIPPSKTTTDHVMIDPLVFGQLLHQVLDQLYSPYVTTTINERTIASLKASVLPTIESVFNLVPYQSIPRQPLLKRIIAALVKKVIRIDEAYTPFTLLGTEIGKGGSLSRLFPLADGRKVLIGGVIDRIDRKGYDTRIIDYKTGSWDATISGIEQLFDPSNPKRNAIAMQLITYAWLYQGPNKAPTGRVMPIVMSSRTLFNASDNGKFWYNPKEGKAKPMEDISLHRHDFEAALRKLLDEIFDPSIPFRANTSAAHSKKCRYPVLCQGFMP